jgi:hypothetical protein
MIYLLPWIQEGYFGVLGKPYYRRELKTNKVIAQITYDYDTNRYWIQESFFYSFEEAAEVLDNELVLVGYYLIKEDEVERFKAKLAVLL